MIKHLLVSIFCLTTLISAQNITGNWQSDWQNSPLVCSPFGFNITQAVDNGTTTTTIDYFFTSDTILKNCAGSNITGNYSSPLTLNQTSNAWQDNIGQQVVYNQVADTVAYLLNSTAIQSLNLYDRNGSFIINGKVGSMLGGNWTGATPVSGNDNCPCIPYQVSPYPQGFSSFNATANLYYSSQSCGQSGQDSFPASLYQPDPQTITWQSNPLNAAQPRFSLNTINASLILTINPGNNTCIYSYTKSQDGLFNGQWDRDWMTPYSGTFAKSFVITTFQKSYMKGIFTFQNQTSQNDYLVMTGSGPGTGQSTYTTFNLQENFVYDSAQNAFSAIAPPINNVVYYTPNGSYFSQEAFTQSWSNPTNTNGTQISPSQCCYPDTIVITPDSLNGSALFANYTYSNATLQSTWCADVVKYLNSSDLTETSLYLSAPSFTQVVWQDEIGYTFKLLSPPSWSNLSVTYTNELDDQCSFAMQLSTPGPNPNPLGANLISIGLAYLFIILVAYL